MRYRFLLCLLIASAIPTSAQQGAKGGEWRLFAGDGGSTRYAPLDQINRNNVRMLKIAWRWQSSTLDGTPEYKNETTPVMINGVLYFTAGYRRNVIAADAGTGKTRWIWRGDEGARYERAPRQNSGRGVAFWSDNRGDNRIFTVTPGFRLVALNAETGRPVQRFGQAGIVDLFKELAVNFDPIGTIGSTSPPVVSHDVVIVGPALADGSHPRTRENTKADVMAFDVRTGRKVWTFHTIPRTGEFGSDTWINGSANTTGNAGVWTPFSVDEELGYVYLPVEAATGDYYGGHRPGANLFSSTLVCLDIRTGRRIWHQQLVHHDIWDYDVAATPILVDLNVEGRAVKAVVQVTKQAFAFVYDRITGMPVWPIDERPVPQSDVPGEWTSPTQPFPTRPPPFDRQGMTRDDLIDFTPELRQMALQALEGYKTGPLFTPPSLANGTIAVPGNLGGANWESGAADPETGFVYIGSQTDPSVYALAKPTDSDMDWVGDVGGLPRIAELPFVKPPYGRITAYNMSRGEIAWQIANGDTPPSIKNNPRLRGMEIPRTGSSSRAGILVTKTLLFAGEGWGGMPMFRAYDKRTGAILWETRIPSGAQSGLPMTYLLNGRQYIVFSAGDAALQNPAEIIAYALPK